MGLQTKKGYLEKISFEEFFKKQIDNQVEGWTSVVPAGRSENQLNDDREMFRSIFRHVFIEFLTTSLSQNISFIAMENSSRNGGGHNYLENEPFVFLGIRQLALDNRRGGGMIVGTKILSNGDLLLYPNITHSDFQADIVGNFISLENYENGRRDFLKGNHLRLSEMMVVQVYDDNLFHLTKLEKDIKEINDTIDNYSRLIDEQKTKLNNISLIKDYMVTNKIQREIKSTIKSSIILDVIKKSKKDNLLTDVSEIIDINF